jgi:DNA polymerase-3 subunit alpha
VESLSHSQKREEKVMQAVEECRSMKITVLPPDINQSDVGFSLEEHEKSLNGLAIRFGLGAVKNVGTAAIESILSVRAAGPFGSFTDFLQRVDARKVNKKVVESLARVGAFDRFSTRSSILENLEQIRSQAAQFQSEVEGQDSLFAAGGAKTVTQVTDTFPQLAEYPQAELLSYEKELLGFYLTDHPMSRMLKEISKQSDRKIADLDPDIHKDQTFVLGGILTGVKQVRTKRTGDKMAFGSLEDQSGSIRVVCFPKTYVSGEKYFQDDVAVLVRGKLDTRDEEPQIVAEKVWSPVINGDAGEEEAAANEPSVEITIPRGTAPEVLKKLGALLKRSPGKTPVLLLIPSASNDHVTKLKLPYAVDWTLELEKYVRELLPTDKVPGSRPPAK